MVETRVEGQKTGNYEIAEVIGHGERGAVYRAVHESLGHSVAVKVLLPKYSRSHDVSRFFNEARAAAALSHPGIVETYDFGFLPDGRACVVMELLEGESLRTRLRGHRKMPYARALQIVRSVARVLDAAHERRIIHRDIKPENIFLVPEPKMPTGERVKLLDFGIAKLGLDGVRPVLRRAGAVMGTLTYMAPEQCGGGWAVDRHTDLYALGCILYELLCGRPPFVANSVDELMMHHLYSEPESPRVHDPGIAPPLEALVLALLQKDPGRRPLAGWAVVKAIDRLGAPEDDAPAELPRAILLRSSKRLFRSWVERRKRP